MSHLSVNAIFEPGHVEVSKHERTTELHPFAVVRFDAHDGPTLGLHLHGLDAVAELETALSQVCEFLTDQAARDAA